MVKWNQSSSKEDRLPIFLYQYSVDLCAKNEYARLSLVQYTNTLPSKDLYSSISFSEIGIYLLKVNEINDLNKEGNNFVNWAIGISIDKSMI